MLIVIESLLWNWKKGRVQLGMYMLSLFLFQGVQKFTLNLGWSKIYKLSIATGVTSTSFFEFFFFEDLQSVFIRFVVDA